MSTNTEFLDGGGSGSPGTLASALDGLPECACGCRQILTGRQKRFASRICCSRWWDQRHPRINLGPVGPRQGTIKALILGYLADGAWRTEQQIADAIHAFAHSVGARLSELRRAGQPIEVQRGGGNVKRYRLVGRP